MQCLTPTKSLNHLRFSFDAMREAYDMYGHTQPEVFFTDNPRGDRRFLEMVLPSLKENVVPVISELHANLPILSIPENITVNVITSAKIINHAINKILEDEMDITVFLGFDAEWNFDPVTKATGRVSIIQIAHKNNIWIIQLCSMNPVPHALAVLLRTSRVVIWTAGWW